MADALHVSREHLRQVLRRWVSPRVADRMMGELEDLVDAPSPGPQVTELDRQRARTMARRAGLAVRVRRG